MSILHCVTLKKLKRRSLFSADAVVTPSHRAENSFLKSAILDVARRLNLLKPFRSGNWFHFRPWATGYERKCLASRHCSRTERGRADAVYFHILFISRGTKRTSGL
jgi:hypothetical protein